MNKIWIALAIAIAAFAAFAVFTETGKSLVSSIKTTLGFGDDSSATTGSGTTPGLGAELPSISARRRLRWGAAADAIIDRGTAAMGSV